jgi:hypothetical protein
VAHLCSVVGVTYKELRRECGVCRVAWSRRLTVKRTRERLSAPVCICFELQEEGPGIPGGRSQWGRTQCLRAGTDSHGVRTGWHV